MSRSENSNYQTLADFARLVGVHRTTVLNWVRSGKIKSKKGLSTPKNQRHRLNQRLFVNRRAIEKLKKPYPKYSNPWSEVELCTMRNWTSSDEGLAKALGRSVNAVRIKRSRDKHGF